MRSRPIEPSWFLCASVLFYMYSIKKSRIVSSMICSLASGSWCRAIWERHSTIHLVETVAYAEMNLDISNKDHAFTV